MEYWKINEFFFIHDFYVGYVGLEEYTLHKHAPPCFEIVREFYTYLQLVMGDQPACSIVKGSDVPFTRAILRAISILDVPEKVSSFTNRVNKIPSNSQRFWEFPTSSITTLMIAFKKWDILESYCWVIIKYNIITSSSTTELYSMDVVLLNMILKWRPFDVVSIMHSALIQYMEQAHIIQHPRVAKQVLVLPSLITKICFNNEIDLLPTNTIARQMMLFMDTIVRRSMSAQ